ncbi:MAG: hypothetical protein L6V93_16765 [Clostridiales bacterium]|nr:MAG: hypothetical protein L6V93_16765 [Clostridiales bacterium]
MSEKHALAKEKTLAREDLFPYTEIVHTDSSTPPQPFPSHKREATEDNITKRIFLCLTARASFDILSQNTDSFMWVSPLTKDLCERYRLVQKKPSDSGKIYKDMLIYRSDYKLSKLDSIFISEVCRVKRECFNFFDMYFYDISFLIYCYILFTIPNMKNYVKILTKVRDVKILPLEKAMQSARRGSFSSKDVPCVLRMGGLNIMKTKNYALTDSVESLETAIARVRKAQNEFSVFSQDKVDRIFLAAASAANKMRIPLAKMAVEETGMGVVEDKVIKNHYASEYIYNAYRTAKTCGVIYEDKAYGIKKIAEPLGVIAAVIPTTNPTSTAIFLKHLLH